MKCIAWLHTTLVAITKICTQLLFNTNTVRLYNKRSRQNLPFFLFGSSLLIIELGNISFY